MNRPEQVFHIQVADYLRLVIEPPAMWFHIPNGGARASWIEGKIFKRLGVLAGIPDIQILNDGRALFIELKADAGKLTTSQEYVIPMLYRAGCPTAVCRTLEEVRGQLMQWEVPLREAKPSVTALRAGLANPGPFPESDAIGRRKRVARPLDFR